MLLERWPLLRHCVDILLGRRRSYRPGALTANIFVEFDRARLRAARIEAINNTRSFKSSPISRKNIPEIKAQRLTLRNERIVVRSSRKPMIVSGSVNRPVVFDDTTSTKRLSHRVVWLERTSKPISTRSSSCDAATDSKPTASNVVALHRLEPVSRPRTRIAA